MANTTISSEVHPEEDSRPGASASPYAATLAGLADISHSDGRPDDLLDSFAATIKSALGADVVTILEAPPDQDMLLVQAAAGLDPCKIGGASVGRELESQAGYTLLRKSTVVLEDVDLPGRPYEMSPLLTDAGVRSGATVPIPPDRALYGVLGVFYTQRHRFSEDDLNFLDRAARYLAGIIVRHQETASRKKTQQWLRALEEATIRSVTATSRASTLHGFAKFLSSTRDGIADLCCIDLESSDGHYISREAAAINGASLTTSSDARPLLYPPDPGCQYGTPAVLDTGQPHTITKVEHEHLECLARNEAHLNAFLGLGITSYMCLPIKRHRHTLGALVLMSCSKAFTREDERHAGRLAYLIGMSIEAIQARMEHLSDAREKVEGYFPALPRDPQPGATAIGVLDQPEALTPDPSSSKTDDPPQHANFLPEQRHTILNLLAQGNTTKRIASKLNISPSTVYNTEHKLRDFFGANDRASLIRKAYKKGYIDEC